MKEKITNHYRSLLDEESKFVGQKGPLHASVCLHNGIEYETEDESCDFVDDIGNMPIGYEDVVIHKYTDRVLFLASFECVGHCQYCCRKNMIHGEYKKQNISITKKITLLKKYLAEHVFVKEVILSGGDPLTLEISTLNDIFSSIKEVGKDINIRIHTRGIVYNPKIVTQGFCNLLKKYNVRFFFHIIHPYEICSEFVDAIKMMNSASIKMYNQFPLLRNVNDHAEILKFMITTLEEMNIRTTSIYISEPVLGNSLFRISTTRAYRIFNTLKRTTPSWVNSLRMVLDTSSGKKNIEDIIRVKSTYAKNMWEHHIDHNFVDFEKASDVESDLSLLLWKGQTLNKA